VAYGGQESELIIGKVGIIGLMWDFHRRSLLVEGVEVLFAHILFEALFYGL
jgi:hypothetical protein